MTHDPRTITQRLETIEAMLQTILAHLDPDPSPAQLAQELPVTIRDGRVTVRKQGLGTTIWLNRGGSDE